MVDDGRKFAGIAVLPERLGNRRAVEYGIAGTDGQPNWRNRDGFINEAYFDGIRTNSTRCIVGVINQISVVHKRKTTGTCHSVKTIDQILDSHCSVIFHLNHTQNIRIQSGNGRNNFIPLSGKLSRCFGPTWLKRHAVTVGDVDNRVVIGRIIV